MEQDKRLKFNPKNHHYTLEVDGVDKPITGVTTILSVIAKPALINWSANMAVDYIKDIWNERDEYNQNEIDEFLKEARKAHAQKRDKAGDIGTLVHTYCETFIKTDKIPEIPDPKAKKMFDNFYLWQKANKVKFLQSERQVFSEKYWFSGTYDFLCEIDNKLFIGDIKTSSNIYPEHFVQCAGYQICEEEMNPKLKINGHIVVNLTKDGTIKTQTNYDCVGYKKVFLSALIIYRELFQKK